MFVPWCIHTVLQGRLSVDTERNFIHPHCFVPVEVTKKKECHFCKHRLQHKAGINCRYTILIHALNYVTECVYVWVYVCLEFCSIPMYSM